MVSCCAPCNLRSRRSTPGPTAWRSIPQAWCGTRHSAPQSGRRGSEDVRDQGIPAPRRDRGPRRIAITRDDIVWCTDFPRGYLGRLDPKTGQVTEWQSPNGAMSRRYGISIINDSVWCSESGPKPNTVVRFDPRTQQFPSRAVPGGGDIVRNTSVTPGGEFVVANSLANAVMLVTVVK